MRLFVAVNLPADERRAVWASAAPLRELGAPVRWASEASLHLTLQFLGEVDEQRAEAVGAALAGAVRGARPFDVAIGGCGAFPDFAAARVLWIGVERHPALELLANDVAGALKPLGFEPELRPFQPHLTIGRVRRDAASEALRGLEGPAGALDYASAVQVDAIDLMESRRGPDGAVYRSVSRAVLGGGS